MAINIAQNQSGQAPEVRLPDVSGANVADVTTAPGPLAGTPQVNPFENPYAAAPFQAAAKAAGEVGDTAQKAYDYFNDLNTANQAMNVDTQRSAYETKQLKTSNDIQAQYRADAAAGKPWSYEQLQSRIKQGSDANWASTVGSLDVANPTVKRMAARLQMSENDRGIREADSFFKGEVQSGARTNLATQRQNSLDRLTEARKIVPGESLEDYIARQNTVGAQTHQDEADRQVNPAFTAILPQGEVQAGIAGYNRALMSELASSRINMNDETFLKQLGVSYVPSLNSKGVTDPNAVAQNTETTKRVVDAYGQIVASTGVNSQTAEALTANFGKEADATRQHLENHANEELVNAQHEQAVKLDGLLTGLEATTEKKLYEGTASPGDMIHSGDVLKTQIGLALHNGTISQDDGNRLLARTELMTYRGAFELKKQQEAKETAAAAQRIKLGAGEPGAVDGKYVKDLEALGASKLTDLRPDQQSQLMTNTLQAQGGPAIAKTLPTPLKGEIDIGIHDTTPLDPTKPDGPTKADQYASIVNQLRTTAPMAYAELDPQMKDIANRIVVDRQPAKDAISAVVSAKIDDNKEQTREIQRAGLKTLGFENGQPKNPSKFLAPLFDQLHSVGQDRDANGNKIDTSNVAPSVMTSYVREIQDNLAKGMSPDSARLTAANTLVGRGFGYTNLGGNAKPTITLRSWENIVGAPALSAPGVAEADARAYGGKFVPGHPASEAGSVTTEAGTEYYEAQPYQARSGIPANAPIMVEAVPGRFDSKGNQIGSVMYKDPDTNVWVPVVRTGPNGQQIPYSFDSNNNYALRNEKAGGQFEQMQMRYLAEEARQAQSQGFIRNGNTWGKMGMQGVGEAGALERFLPDHDATTAVNLKDRNDQNFPQSKEAFKKQFAEQNKGKFNEELWNKVNP